MLKLSNGMQGFNEEDGKPRKCTEMKQWPYHEFLKEQGMHKDYFKRWHL